jgi:hypothetical protein
VGIKAKLAVFAPASLAGLVFHFPPQPAFRILSSKTQNV